jgi:hypothetical protein
MSNQSDRRVPRLTVVASATTIEIPDYLVRDLESAVEDVARRLGTKPDLVRRLVEVTVLKRGIEAMRREGGRIA